MSIVEAQSLNDSLALRTAIRSRQHETWADEPEADGGTDTAPTPYELLIQSLAACTVITLKMYCKHKGYALSRLNVEVRMAPPDRSATEVRIERILDIEGDFDPVVKERLLKVAESCPVHRLLSKQIHITTVWG
jgi:putative redox protein